MLASDFLKDVEKPPQRSIVVVPFAKPEILDWLGTDYIIMAYSTDPQSNKVFKRDSLATAPRYNGAYVIGFPPWDRKNDTEDKTLFDLHASDNLYKCFIKTMLKSDNTPLGGTIIVPLSFLTGTRESEVGRRKKFLENYRIKVISIYKTTLIQTYMPVVISFIRRSESKPNVEIIETITYPEKTHHFIEYYSLISQFGGHDPLVEYPKPQKKIQVEFNKNGILYFDKTRLSRLSNSDSKEIYIRGFVSKRLLEVIIRDFNAWSDAWLARTCGLFLKYKAVESSVVQYISSEIVVEAIQRIIWKYFIHKPRIAYA